jgi:hypothetical protein
MKAILATASLLGSLLSRLVRVPLTLRNSPWEKTAEPWIEPACQAAEMAGDRELFLPW